MDKKILEPHIRYTPPTRYDKAPYGSLCKVMKDNDESTLYIQINEEEDQAEWMQISDFLEKVFSNHILNNGFINACLVHLKYNLEINNHKETWNSLMDALKFT